MYVFVDSNGDHRARRPDDRPSRRRPVPGALADRARRHGDRVPRDRPAARAPRRDQDHARASRRRQHLQDAVHPGGPFGRAARAPERRERLRPGPGRRHGVPRHGVPARHHPARAAEGLQERSRPSRPSTSWTPCSRASRPRTRPASCTATSSPRTCCSPTTAASRSATSASRAPRARTRRPGQALLGTIAYLSPELVTRGIADARSDIYAVGIMMYEMLTGEQPYMGEAADADRLPARERLGADARARRTRPCRPSSTSSCCGRRPATPRSVRTTPASCSIACARWSPESARRARRSARRPRW